MPNSQSQPFLVRVCQQLAAHRVRYALVGGHAVALHGAVRGTVDVDVVLNWSLAALRRAEKAFQELELLSRLPLVADDVFNFRDEYVRNRNLIAWNFYNPNNPSEQVDLIVTYDLTGRAVKKLSIGPDRVQILNRQDLITMKQDSARPQDLEDVKALEKLA